MRNDDTSAKSGAVSRRDLVRGAALIAAAAGTAAATKANAAGVPGTVLAEDPLTRADRARQTRMDAANANFGFAPMSAQPINSDEALYSDYRGNFSKTLRHNALGEVDPSSYQSLLHALSTRSPADFEAILVGRPTDPNRNRLVSPQAAYAFEMTGMDGNACRIPVAPAFVSAVTQAEMAELYWYSVTRDIPFADYETDAVIREAAEDLNGFSRKDIFARSGGSVTPATLFRAAIHSVGTPPGALDGPFVSQFLLQPFQVGQLVVEQRYPRLERGGANQFLTRFDEWLAVQNGFDPNAGPNPTSFKSGARYLSRMRDLSEWVHRDFPQQSGLHALAVVMALNDEDAFDPSMAYLRAKSATQQGFVSFGLPDMSHLISHAPRQALTGAWFQKWACHRRLRPEAYGGRINVQLRGLKNYGIGAELLGSKAFARAADEVRRVNGTKGSSANDGLLPVGFPESCPAHPAYPGGHSSFVAAAATALKAFLNEDYVFPNAVAPHRSGAQLVPYTASALTIGGELNKLVSNVTHARDAAGLHWRSDGVGNLIGEAVAIALLRDYSVTYNEEIDGLTLRKFDGQKIRIRNGLVENIAG